MAHIFSPEDSNYKSQFSEMLTMCVVLPCEGCGLVAGALGGGCPALGQRCGLGPSGVFLISSRVHRVHALLCLRGLWAEAGSDRLLTCLRVSAWLRGSYCSRREPAAIPAGRALQGTARRPVPFALLVRIASRGPGGGAPACGQAPGSLRWLEPTQRCPARPLQGGEFSC